MRLHSALSADSDGFALAGLLVLSAPVGVGTRTALAKRSNRHGLARIGATLLALSFATGVTGCSQETTEGPRGTASVDVAESLPVSGIYDVSGSTVALAGGDPREIAGTVILRQEGDRYTASFTLDTTYPGVAEPLAADVIGNGEGSIAGRTLTGSTETQLVVATVPGVDPDFAFIPRIVGARIVSSSVTEIAPDGTVVIELENRPAPGEDYQPTRTRLVGARVADVGNNPPDVAADAAR